MVWHQFFGCSVKLFLCVCVFPSPRTALSVGVEVGGTWSNGLHCIAWLRLGVSSFFFLSASLLPVPLILLSFPTLFLWGVPQCQSITFSLELRQCSQAITWETLFIPPYRVNAGGILKRNKMRESPSHWISHFLCLSAILFFGIDPKQSYSWPLNNTRIGAPTSCDVENPHKTTIGPLYTRIPIAKLTLKQHRFDLYGSSNQYFSRVTCTLDAQAPKEGGNET